MLTNYGRLVNAEKWRHTKGWNRWVGQMMEFSAEKKRPSIDEWINGQGTHQVAHPIYFWSSWQLPSLIFFFWFILVLYFYLLGRFPGRLSEIPAANNVTWANPMNRSRHGLLRRRSNKRKIEAAFYPFFIRFAYLMLRQLKIARGFVKRPLEGIIFVIRQKIGRKYSFS